MEQGVAVWVTGADGGACLAVAQAIADRLERRHVATELIAPGTPGIETIAGAEMDRRAAFAASCLVRHGVATVVAVPSHRRAERDAIRAAVGRLIEVYVPGGGVAAYEPPDRAEVEGSDPRTTADRTLRTLELLGYLRTGDDPAYSAEEERQVIARLKSFGYL